MWSIDGSNWDVPCTIEREAEVTASEVSGMLLNKQYFNDVIGTFMRYTISLAIPIGMESDYKYIYELLTQPVDAHAFVFPYNDGYINLTGRVEVVSDKYYRGVNNANGWKGIKFTVIANHPSKEQNLSDAISRGITPMPIMQHIDDGEVFVYDGGWEEAELETGKTYLFNSNYEFVEAAFEDADNKEY
jgi:hypothetical protein